MSPAQVMFGRSTRTLLSIANTQLMPTEKDAVKHKGRLYENKLKQARNYNKHAKDMKTLSTGDTVRVKPMAHNKLWRKANVEENVGLRSYTVRTEDDSVYRRNRRHLRKTNEPVQLHECYTDKDEDAPIEREPVNRHIQILANKSDDMSAPAATQGIDMQTIMVEKATTPKKQIEEDRQMPSASERRYPQRTRKKPDRLSL